MCICSGQHDLENKNISRFLEFAQLQVRVSLIVLLPMEIKRTNTSRLI